MVRRFSGRPMRFLTFAASALLAVSMPVFAQTNGIVKGKVTDDKGQPVEGATVVIEMTGGYGGGRSVRLQTKTDRKGEYFQIGVAVGTYTVTAEKEKMGSRPSAVSIRPNNTHTIDLVLNTASASAAKEMAAKSAELKKIFEEGVALSGSGQHAAAIEKFNAGATVDPSCYECYSNIGFSYAQMKEWDKAEAAYKRSIQVKADDATAYNGLATVYNAQRKFDLAAEASAKATQYGGGAGAGAGGAEVQFNQAVILWNAGKIAEAKKAFEAVLASNPNHAEAHYQLGMALVNEGNMAGAATEFETYLKLAPEGPNAATAKSLVSQLKP